MSPSEAWENNLLEPFAAELQPVLIQFSKYIAALKCDYIIFMARKALRLHDLLLMMGGPVPEVPVLSDHSLDQDLTPFQNKTICIIDDTLILGTTLGTAKRKLLVAGALSVTAHVFALDEENWCTDLIVPDRVFVRLNHQQMLTFCTAEVLAFADAGIPYLSDFPFSEPYRIAFNRIPLLHSLQGWEVHALTSQSQVKRGVRVYSFLPDDDTCDLLLNAIGSHTFDLIDIAKIRGYSRDEGHSHTIQFVPIVTLGAMQSGSIDLLFTDLIEHLAQRDGRGFSGFRRALVSSTGKCRFVQYVLSVALAHLFFSDIRTTSGTRQALRISGKEGTRLFGPWLTGEIQRVHRIVPVSSGADAAVAVFQTPQAKVVGLPAQLAQKSKSEYREFTAQRRIAAGGAKPAPRSMLTDLIRAFIGLHQKYELAARREAHRLGSSLFTAPSSDAPYRDRLNYGFAWRTISDILLEDARFASTFRRKNWLSLILDTLVDMGIVVPVICHRDDVVFRAYRYGEGVVWGNQESGLAHEVVRAYMTGSRSDAVPRIVLEKLLVSLINVGIGRQFMRPQHGLSGSDNVARIGFHLFGAIAIVPRYTTIFADGQDTWLSSYLVELGVLNRQKGGKYELGERPEAAFLKVTALREATQLGLLLGILSISRTGSGEPVLDAKKLISLTACSRPRDAAAALAAEIRIFSRWYDTGFIRIAKTVEWRNIDKQRKCLRALTSSNVSLALESAFMKLEAYLNGSARQIVDGCARYLSTVPNGELLEAHWLADWEAVLAENSEAQRSTFDPCIAALSSELAKALTGMFLFQYAVLASIISMSPSRSEIREFKILRNSIRSRLGQLRKIAKLDDHDTRVCDRLLAMSDSLAMPEAPAEIFNYGKQWIDLHVHAMRVKADQTEDLVRNFGLLVGRVDFDHVLWYDVIDSKGAKSGLAGSLLIAYRQRIAAFKRGAKRDLTNLTRETIRDFSVYGWQGRLESHDDEKHVFARGPNSLDYLKQVAIALFDGAKLHRVKIRAVMIRANFAGLSPSKMEFDPVVQGQPFWERLSIVKHKLKGIEEEIGVNRKGEPPRASFLWLATDIGERPNLQVLGFEHWAANASRYLIETKIDNAALVTEFQGGALI